MTPNMAQQFGMIQKIQKEMARLQENLKKMSVEGSAGGGMVTVKVSGSQRVISVKIDPEVVDSNDVEMLEDLVTAATNQALEKAAQLAQDEMSKITGGMLGNLPGGLKIPGINI